WIGGLPFMELREAEEECRQPKSLPRKAGLRPECRTPQASTIGGRPSALGFWLSAGGRSEKARGLMSEPTFEEFAEFVRDFGGVPRRIPISPAARIEEDLGIYGGDGVALLLKTQERFGVELAAGEGGLRKTFNLGPDECLFHGEGFDLLGIS